MSTRYNTGNPIESTDVRDMSDNARNFDEFSNSISDSFADRFGRDRQTIEGSIRKAGFQPAAFDFVTGGTLVSGDRNKAVFNPAPSGDNNWYAWQGAFPKIISPNSIPATSGGLGENSWKPVTNNILAPTVRESTRRSYAEAGYNLVAGSFQAGFTLVNINDVALDEASGKAFSGAAGAYPAGTSTVGFIDRSFLASPQATQSLLSANLTGVQKVKTVAFSAAWAALSMAIGGASWASTGVVDNSKASSINDGYLYDAVGNQFTIAGTRVSPQQLGATPDVDCSALFQMCLNNRKVFLEDDIKLTSQSSLTVDKTTVNLCGNKITCSLSSADVRAIDLNNKKKFKVENGDVAFITSGKFLYGNVKGAKIYDVDFTGGTLAIQFVGTYGDECTDIRVKDCTHDGTMPVNGAGGFFSVQIGRRIHITGCTGKNGGEFIDINNLCSHVWIRDCLSENYKQNHLDINSAWHVNIDGYTIISTISGLTGRPVWVSDSTLSEWPAGAPDRLKNSNYVSIKNFNFRIENMDYTEFFIINCGTLYNPFTTDGRRLVMSVSDGVFDNDTGILSNDKIKIGVVADVIQWDVHDVTFKGAGARVVGSGKFHGNTFDAEQEGYVGTALDVRFANGDTADNVFYGWTGTPTVSTTGGVIFARECVGTTFTSNKLKSTTACYAPITSQDGGTNEYIENRYRMTVTQAKGVRSNPGDVVIYNGA